MFMVLGLPLPGMQDGGILSQIYMVISILGFLVFPLLFVFGGRILVWNADRKIKRMLMEFESYRDSAEESFFNMLDPERNQKFEQDYTSLKNFKVSQPTSIDPQGLVNKLENVLDSSDSKFRRFVEENADEDATEEELANMEMAFRGVVGTHQIYKITRHYRKLIKETENFQLVTLINMMLPMFKEVSEAQKEAVRAFENNVPTGDGIGPLVASKMISEEPDEISKDIVHSEEEIDGQKTHIIKSNGPGAKLGKYGDAVEEIAEQNDLEAVITVDAGAKLEGEETGSISQGVGVMMGGPGVEKTKIENVAEKHSIPLEGVIIKQSPAEASKPMKQEIYDSWESALDRVQRNAQEFDGPVAIVGVGNTCGVPNVREETSSIPNQLKPFWEEYEEMEDDVSYVGLMGTMGGGDQQHQNWAQTLLNKTVRN